MWVHAWICCALRLLESWFCPVLCWFVGDMNGFFCAFLHWIDGLSLSLLDRGRQYKGRDDRLHGYACSPNSAVCSWEHAISLKALYKHVYFTVDRIMNQRQNGSWRYWFRHMVRATSSWIAKRLCVRPCIQLSWGSLACSVQSVGTTISFDCPNTRCLCPFLPIF